MKTILITGGSSGIGKALVYLAAKKGYYVIFTYNQKKNSAFNIKKKLGKNCLAIKVNFLKDNAVNNLFKILIKKKLRIDYVVNFAAFNVNLFSTSPKRKFRAATESSSFDLLNLLSIISSSK